MKTLSIDTSAGSSVAVHDGEAPIARGHSADHRKHAESLAPLITEALASAGLALTHLDAVIVGIGPAPYTGLRSGIITAQMLARGANLPLYGVSPLAGIARQILDRRPQATVLVATDARRREVYGATFRALGDDDVELVDGPRVGSAATVATDIPGGGCVVAGRGALLYAEHLPPTPDVDHDLDVATFHRIAAARLAAGRDDLLGTAPLYLRRPDVSLPQAAKRVS